MAVNKLTVRNLGPLKEATLPAKPVVLLLGPNESGKSTLVQALFILRFGAAPGMDVKDNAQLTHEGAPSGWSIEANVDGLELRATRSQRNLQEDFEKVLGDPRVFRALCQGDRFQEMKPAERRELVADLVAADTSTLADLLASEECPVEVVAAVREGNLKRAHAIAQEARRAADRLVADLEARAGAEVVDEEVETKGGKARISTIPLERVDQTIVRLRSRRDDALTLLARRRAYDDATRDAKAAQAELEGVKAEGAWGRGDESELANLTAKIDAARQAVLAAATQRDHHYREADALAKLLKAADGACPTCKTKLAGPVRKAVEEAKLRHESEGLKANDENRTQVEGMKPLEDKRRAMLDRKESAQKLTTVRRRLQDRIDRVAHMEAPAQPSPDDLPEALDAEIARLEKMRDRRRAYDLALGLQAKAKDAIAERKPRQEKLARWEGLVKPGQVAGEEEVLQELNAYIDQAATLLFPGEPGSVLVTKGWEVLVHHRPLSALVADSARIRAGLACAAALTRLSKLGLLFVDRLESIDDVNRRGLMSLLKKGVDDGWLRNAYVAGVKMDPKPSSQVPWLAWVKVGGGTATVLE